MSGGMDDGYSDGTTEQQLVKKRGLYDPDLCKFREDGCEAEDCPGCIYHYYAQIGGGDAA